MFFLFSSHFSRTAELRFSPSSTRFVSTTYSHQLFEVFTVKSLFRFCSYFKPRTHTHTPEGTTNSGALSACLCAAFGGLSIYPPPVLLRGQPAKKAERSAHTHKHTHTHTDTHARTRARRSSHQTLALCPSAALAQLPFSPFLASLTAHLPHTLAHTWCLVRANCLEPCHHSSGEKIR